MGCRSVFLGVLRHIDTERYLAMGGRSVIVVCLETNWYWEVFGHGRWISDCLVFIDKLILRGVWWWEINQWLFGVYRQIDIGRCLAIVGRSVIVWCWETNWYWEIFNVGRSIRNCWLFRDKLLQRGVWRWLVDQWLLGAKDKMLLRGVWQWEVDQWLSVVERQINIEMWEVNQWVLGV